MGSYKDFNVKVDMKEVVRLLGYKDGEPSKEIKDAIKSEIEKYSTYIKPQITWKKINITEIRQNDVLLENGVLLEGKFISEKLEKCQYAIMAIYTVGQEVDKIIKLAFDSEDYLRGMILECIAAIALEQIEKELWGRMVKSIEGSKVGITARISPGDAAWDLKEQAKIFECLRNNNILEVTLTESYMMMPLKSASVLYGFGEGIGITRTEHLCSECSMKNCMYRIKEKVEVVIRTESEEKIIKVHSGSNLLDILRKNNMLIDSPCGSKGTCGKCKVLITKGAQEPSEVELKHLSIQEIDRGIRLACSTTINSNLEIYIDNKNRKMNIITTGEEKNVKVNPMGIKKYLELDRPSLEDQRDDYKRIADAVGMTNLIINYDLLSRITGLLKDNNYHITVSLYGNVLLDIEGGNTVGNNFGVAVDIGTTTIVCYLLNLTNGKTIDVESSVNNQKEYGYDVISRINFTIENESGTQILKNIVLGQINEIVSTLCKKNNISKNNIYNMAVVGNTTMIHFFLGLSTKNIALAPFIPVLTNGIDLKAADIGIDINGYVNLLPGIASYVGSDITSGILASGMMDSDKYSLLLDLGTNGEIALGNSSRIITCSSAAGPAFEGANIKCGTGGVNGAISKVNLSEKNIYETINGSKACGICGSGVLDIVSEFIKHKIIDETGRMLDKSEMKESHLTKRLNFKDSIKEFLLEEDTSNKEPIVFTQKDVRELQLAKASIAAGIQLMMKEMGIDYNDIVKVYIGGGFGNFMNVESAVTIGLIPSALREKVYFVGNSAGTGAKLYLISIENRKKIYEIIKITSYIELSKRKDFQDYYIDSMMF